jgi:hypothetical protein
MERLGEMVNATYGNGINEARRNKFLMMETLRGRGIPCVQQQLCTTESEATEFAKQFVDATTTTIGGSTAVVVKPVRGCASDGVYLCPSPEDVRRAFRRIINTTIVDSPSQKHTSVLVQECLVGQEYAVDTVSCNGRMKIAAVWMYDKRPLGTAPFVYYATKLCDDTSVTQTIYDYLDECLQSLNIQWGMTHSEIILTSTGPKLVEVNCRQHNMNFLPLVMTGIGYNIFDMLLAAYSINEENDGIDDDNDDEKLIWDLLPDIPIPRMSTAMVHLVNDKHGVLKSINEDALYEIQSMESVHDLEVYHHFLNVGEPIEPTVDIKTDAGWVQLIHPDRDIFEKDYQRIVELMPTLFEVE